MSSKNKPYITSDFQIAVYLYSSNIPLIEITWKTSNRAEFKFENSDTVKQAITGFWSGEALVDARKLLNAQRELKQMLYEYKTR